MGRGCGFGRHRSHSAGRWTSGPGDLEVAVGDDDRRTAEVTASMVPSGSAIHRRRPWSSPTRPPSGCSLETQKAPEVTAWAIPPASHFRWSRWGGLRHGDDVGVGEGVLGEPHLGATLVPDPTGGGVDHLEGHRAAVVPPPPRNPPRRADRSSGAGPARPVSAVKANASLNRPLARVPTTTLAGMSLRRSRCCSSAARAQATGSTSRVAHSHGMNANPAEPPGGPTSGSA